MRDGVRAPVGRFAVVLAVAAFLGTAGMARAEVYESAGQEWGVNFWIHSYYTGDAAFVDVTRIFAPWENPDEMQLTEQGIPLEEAETQSLLRGYPRGIYKLRYAGTGRVTFSGLGRIVPGSLERREGYTYCDVQVQTPGEEALVIQFSQVDRNDPVRDVRLTCPGYEVDTKRVVRDEFLRRTRPFSTFRFMDWARTNSSNAGTWTERRTQDYFIQTGAWQSHPRRGGMAWEIMIDVCNEAGKNCWLCVPHTADEDYMRQMAELCAERLDPSLTLYIELSNELWNFSQGRELAEMMDIGEESLYYGAVAPRTEMMSRIFQEAFRERPDTLNVVLAGQISNSWHVAEALRYYTENDLDPGDVVDSISIAPYMHARSKTHDQLDELMDDMMEYTRTKLRQGVARHAELAERHGLELNAYEGGQHVWYNSLAEGRSHLLEEAQRDPRLRDAYFALARTWQQEGGGLFMHYTFTSGSWGLLGDLREPGSIKWDAAMSILLPEGDVDLDGRVTYEDVRATAQKLGKEGWWEQGDFNGDRQVDLEDLRLLARNVTGLKESQQQELNLLLQQ